MLALDFLEFRRCLAGLAFSRKRQRLVIECPGRALLLFERFGRSAPGNRKRGSEGE